MPPAPQARPPFHVGVVVPDIERAIDELGRAMGLRFNEPRALAIDDWRIRIAMGYDGPPYLELVEGGPGTPWDASDGPRLDHLAWFSDDLDADTERIQATGAAIEVDGRPAGRGVTYLRGVHSGLRIELLSERPEHFLERWGLGG